MRSTDRTRNKHEQEQLEDIEFTFTNPDEIEVTEKDYALMLNNFAEETGVTIGEMSRQEYIERYVQENEDFTEIAVGGEGRVFKVQQEGHTRLDKIHSLPPSLWEADAIESGLVTEATLLSNIEHEATPKYHGIKRVLDTSYWMSSREFIEGTSLDLIRANEEQLIKYISTAANHLGWLNEPINHPRVPFPIIHRDIKPSNIMITPEERVKLIDFTTASAKPNEFTTVAKITPEFISEQQFKGIIDPRNDTYSLGMSIIAATLGTLPDEMSKGFAGIQPDITDVPLTNKVRNYVRRMVDLNIDNRPMPIEVGEELRKIKNVQVAVPATQVQQRAATTPRFATSEEAENEAASYLEDILYAASIKVDTPYETTPLTKKKLSYFPEDIVRTERAAKDHYIRSSKLGPFQFHPDTKSIPRLTNEYTNLLDKMEAFAKAAERTKAPIENPTHTEQETAIGMALIGASQLTSATVSAGMFDASIYTLAGLAMLAGTASIVPYGIYLNSKKNERMVRDLGKQLKEIEQLPELAKDMYSEAENFIKNVQSLHRQDERATHTIRALEYMLEHRFDTGKLLKSDGVQAIRTKKQEYEKLLEDNKNTSKRRRKAHKNNLHKATKEQDNSDDDNNGETYRTEEMPRLARGRSRAELEKILARQQTKAQSNTYNFVAPAKPETTMVSRLPARPTLEGLTAEKNPTFFNENGHYTGTRNERIAYSFLSALQEIAGEPTDRYRMPAEWREQTDDLADIFQPVGPRHDKPQQLFLPTSKLHIEGINNVHENEEDKKYLENFLQETKGPYLQLIQASRQYIHGIHATQKTKGDYVKERWSTKSMLQTLASIFTGAAGIVVGAQFFPEFVANGGYWLGTIPAASALAYHLPRAIRLDRDELYQDLNSIEQLEELREEVNRAALDFYGAAEEAKKKLGHDQPIRVKNTIKAANYVIAAPIRIETLQNQPHTQELWELPAKYNGKDGRRKWFRASKQLVSEQEYKSVIAREVSSGKIRYDQGLNSLIQELGSAYDD